MRLDAGESTVAGKREGYEEFWRQRVADADVAVDADPRETEPRDGDPADDR